MAEGRNANLGIQGFLYNMKSFAFCPPSNNLWTVEIRHNYAQDQDVISNATGSQIKLGKTLYSLYTAILAKNKNWKNIISTNWEMELNNTDMVKTFVQTLSSNDNQIFLAESVTITGFENQYDNGLGNELVQHGGFINFGRTFSNMQFINTCTINFLVSNINICDILIEPWIAAIAQQGLTETSDSASLRADIVLTQYAASVPVSGKEATQMVPLKRIQLFRAIPQKRGTIEYNYETGSAGIFAKESVSFQFDEYKTTYLKFSE